MNRFNLNVFLNSYADGVVSNNPSLNNFKWLRSIDNLSADKPLSASFSLAPGESKSLFDGTRTLLHDGTTQYQLSLKVGSLSVFVLKHVGGTSPQFRLVRAAGSDATTQVSVTMNGNVLTFASTGGTSFNLLVGGVVVGDEVVIGDAFAGANRGQFKVIAVSATSFSVENLSGAAEGPITLGATFADQVRIFGAAGVQVGDKVRIFGGFSPASQNSYEITRVQDNLVEFYFTGSLPGETVTTNSVAIYSSAKQFLYLEASKKCSLSINGSSAGVVEPVIVETTSKPGLFLKTATMWSASIQNDSIDLLEVFFASIE